MNGGRLSGNGVVSAALVNAAEVSLGSSPGTLTIVGSYTQISAGTLNVELGGLAPGSQHARLVVTGPVTLDGALQVSFINGFVAGSGDSFNVLSYASRCGAFGSVTAAPLPGGVTMAPNYTATNLELVVSDVHPRLASVVRLADGSLAIQVTGPNGSTQQVQGSTNLLVWEPLSTMTLSDGPGWFTNLFDPGHLQRLFRLRTQ